MRQKKVRSGAQAKASEKKAPRRLSPLASAAGKKNVRARERKDPELRAAMERLGGAYDHSPLAVIEWSSADLRVRQWSSRASQLFGWRADEAIGKRAKELRLLHADDFPAARAALTALARGQEARSTAQYRTLRRDGSVVHCEWYSSAIRAKTARSIISLILDVSDREDAQAALHAAKARLSSIVAALPHGFTIIDRNWRYTDVSEPAARLIGKTRDELLGRSIWELFPDAGDEFRSHCERAWREQKPVTFEYYSPALDRWHEVFLYPLANGLTVQGYDVTDRKRAEQSLRESELRLRTVLENTPEGYAIYDSDRRFVYLNSVNLKLTNLKLEEVVGKRDEELWPEEVTRTYVPQLKRVYETGIPQKFELDTTAVNGEVFTKILNLVPIKDAEGKVRHVVGASFDLTERKRFERTLLEADRLKTEFLALLSHELRNPLTPIRYSLFVLDHASAGSKQTQQARAILGRQVDHLARIIDDLLDVTRISRGKVRLQRSKLDLKELVQRAVDDHRSLFASKEIALEMDVAKKRIEVDADPARITQIVGNLLQNAAKFTPQNGRVSLTLEADKASRKAVMRVRDTGVGISAEALPRLFRPFQQATESLDRSSNGLGLGLALVRSLVEMHGGEVDVRSQGLGTGAEFIVTLPLERGGTAKVKHRPEVPNGPPRRILIIEDNLDAATALGDFFKLAKHQVQIAHTGPAGLDKARSFRPDIVFCDIGLPGIDGYRVAKSFRADKQLCSTYLVALTGYALPDDRVKAHAAGFDRHLAKPPELAKLREVLAEAPFRE
jgi:two-component system CheB/CheR fusion protein